jgi:hypothetical protein
MIFETARRLGVAMESGWRAARFDEDAFASIAQLAFRECLAGEEHRLKAREILADLSRTSDVPLQHLDSQFGQPPIMLFRSERFYIEAIFWFEGSTTIHQHAFSGAFYVADGASVHTTYAFELSERVNSSIQVGALSFLATERLAVGDVRPIVAGRKFIHSLFHLDHPSVTLVARTYSTPETLPQFNYWPPFLAEDRSSRPPGLLVRRLQAAATLRRFDHSAYLEMVGNLIRLADPLLSLLLVGEALSNGSADAAAPLMEDMRRSLGKDLAEQIWAASIARARIDSLTRLRRRLKTPGLRFFLALVMNVPSPAQIYQLIGEYTGASDPVDVAIDWIVQMSKLLRESREADKEDGPLPRTDRRLFSAVLNGRSSSNLLAELRDELGESEVATQEAEIVNSYRDLQRDEFLKPLILGAEV